MSRLRAVDLFSVELRFTSPVLTAAGTHRVRPVAFVRIETDESEGFGECAALTEGTAVDPPFDAVLAAFERTGIDRLLAAASARGGVLPQASQVPALFGSSPAAHMVAATLEMAVLDAEVRASATSLWSRLDVDEEVARAGVPVGHLVGIPEGRRVDSLVDRVGALVGSGATARVRVKIEPGWDVEPLRALREAFGDLALQADANGSYRMDGDGDGGGLDDAMRLIALDDLEISCVEQPLVPGDLAALAQFAARLETPIALDESLTSLGRVRDALRYGACDVACVKPARLGGLLRARAAAAACHEAGVGAFVGGFFETGLARSANASLAGLATFTLVGDLSDPGEYLQGPVGASSGAYPGLDGARLRLFDGPGIAPVPDLAAAVPLRTWRAP
ncbi:MAG TPA: enolase C-terminal domain-like protein [Acidimicrobiales bacterium]|nr:enolase C-terminal domain-like protein [Acidimicrobiales bacterium]